MTSKFDQLPLRIKLMAAFGLLTLLCALSGGIALWHLQRTHQNLDDLVSDAGVKLALAQDVSVQVHIGVESIMTTMVITDPAAIQATMKRINTALQRFLKGREELRQRYRDDAEASRLVDAVYEINDKRAVPEFQRFAELVKQGQRDEAGRWLTEHSGPSMQALQDAISQIVTYQTNRNAELQARSTADYALAQRVTLGAILLSLVAGVVLSLQLSRRLGQALGAEPAALGAMAQRIADGDLSPLPAAAQAPHGSVLASLGSMQHSLATIVEQIRSGSDSIATASSQISTGNADLSQRTEQQASNLQETASSMEEIAGTIRSSADTARHADQLATQASAAAAQGGEQMSEVVHTMQDITTSSQRIADIIGVIDGIAFQTNILALNAAVEAARAGEQGRGFAVVASEVRSLAGRSAEAAREIKRLIGVSVEKVEIGARQVDAAGTSMGAIVSQIHQVSQLINELSGAAEQQSQGIVQVNSAVQQLDQMTQQNAALVEESAAAAESLRGQATRLTEAVSVFTLGHPSAPAGR
ncbi:MCP four helix bundle domain-containing protein [Ideonella sp. B7]|uniref:methyl-accepting chemotaxis protein n=1 Tax=Ideonella benzenivorans TaxID=2831643 RepID=UPI001CEC8C6C|nr:methyl-accepting chemotaxis protein [Ideonella benzenivorans]MCA6218426.1 MCP four helix bundle domain-containing protein [Ideonella benzenivorans]